MAKQMRTKTRKSTPREGHAVIWPQGACEVLGISSWSRWALERRGVLPVRDFHLGGRSGWKRSTFERFVNSRTQPQASR
jgi:hypothetical protein